ACRCADRAGIVKVMVPAHSMQDNVRFERKAELQSFLSAPRGIFYKLISHQNQAVFLNHPSNSSSLSQ
ncbi:hypothetical protein ACQWV3_003358, partial [Cronobacter malonaticus]